MCLIHTHKNTCMGTCTRAHKSTQLAQMARWGSPEAYLECHHVWCARSTTAALAGAAIVESRASVSHSQGNAHFILHPFPFSFSWTCDHNCNVTAHCALNLLLYILSCANLLTLRRKAVSSIVSPRSWENQTFCEHLYRELLCPMRLTQSFEM